MNRSKLDYMIKDFPIEAKEEIIHIIDPDGQNYFHFLARDFLMNPNTKDVWTLSFIPANYKPENIKNTKLIYKLLFKRINEIFIENKVFPLFENPEDLTQSELTRREIIKKNSERYLNNYFGVDSFYNYKPPIYEQKNDKS